jgi:AcrR family transcriptional regulator
VTTEPRSTAARSRRRADAERNIGRITAAARTALSKAPDTPTDDIAREAGVGRMTLYGHFRTRADLVEAALVDALRDGEQVLAAVDLSGDARDAMARLLDRSWALVAEVAGLVTAAQGVLPAGRLRDLHDNPARRVDDLIRRGREEGVFRTDLPTAWLVSAVQYLLHGAAEELRAGRLHPHEAAEAVTKSVLSLLTPPNVTPQA